MDSSDKESLVSEMISHLKTPKSLVDRDEESEIGRFYAGRSVFITGSTGFIGKALVEKLVRSCSEIKKIYLLIREKRGKGIEERLDELISSKNFDRIRQLNSGGDQLLREKLHPIKGDITFEKFGVSKEDMKILANECTIVFNSAATIRFSEPIDIAVRNNIYSVSQLVEFCNQLDKLEALVHLSTAYSNCHKKDTIYEILYEPPMSGFDVQDAISKLSDIQRKMHIYPESFDKTDSIDNRYGMASASRDSCEQQKFYFDDYSSNDLLASAGPRTGQKSMSNGQLEQRGTKSDKTTPMPVNGEERPYDLLEEFAQIALRKSNRPNTYTFTKAISESYLIDRVKAQEGRYLYDKIPVAIVRPSIVGGAWREPLVGLVDNFNGPTGAILSLYTGALQAMPGMGDNVADLVPVDMVTNMVLAVGWYLVDKEKTLREDSMIQSDQGAYLFNFVSGYQNPLRWHQVTDKIAELAYRYPSKYLTRLPASYFIKAGRFYELFDTINQKFPAHLSDFVRKNLLAKQVEGRSSSVFGYRKIKQMTDTLTPFTSNQWLLCDSNTRNLFGKLSSRDKSLFHFDVKSIDWDDYLKNYIIGSRIYTLKDEAKNVLSARRSLKRRELFNTCFMAISMFIFFFLILYYVFGVSSTEIDS